MKGKPQSLSMLCAGTFAILIVAGFMITPVLAQDATPPPQECQCKQCHEQQYYLYDTGKWYCLCEAPMTCVHCHGGNGGETNADLAHKGMLTNPFLNEAAVCQDCHKEESQSRVDAFVTRAGAGAMPIALEAQPAYHTAEPRAFPETERYAPGPWEWFGTALMSGVLVLLFIAWRK